MKFALKALAAVAMLSSGMVMAQSPVNGTVKFEGAVGSAACGVDGSTQHQTVQLGEWNIEALKTPGYETPATPFKITLKNCTLEEDAANPGKKLPLSSAKITFNYDYVPSKNGVIQVTNAENAPHLGIALYEGATGTTAVDSGKPISTPIYVNGDFEYYFNARIQSLSATPVAGKLNANATWTFSQI